jgi:hypothetical protein
MPVLFKFYFYKAVASCELHQHYQHALDPVVSSRARQAFQIEDEPEAIRE